MASDFFARQRKARLQTNWLRLIFALAMGLASTLTAVGIVFVLSLLGPGLLQPKSANAVVVSAFFGSTIGWTIAACVLLFMVAVSAVTAWRLRGGGTALAESLRARLIDPDSTNIAESRLMNIVAEVALAAQVPRPAVYILDRETSINAFAAGRKVDSAVIGLTAGAVQSLDRDELQAVIAHEFSHILNGDMALNTRLIAWLSGLFAVERIARFMRPERKYDADGKPKGGFSLLFWWWHLGFWVLHACGYVGLLIGQLLQSAICRRRERLADASAVQFTRNPQALKSALLKIEAAAGTTRQTLTRVPGMAHMFIAATDTAPTGWLVALRASLLATHPPMEERVRILDSRMSAQQFRAAVRNTRKSLLAATQQATTPVVIGGESLQAKSVAPATSAQVPPPDLLCSRLDSEQQRAVIALRDKLIAAPVDCAALFIAAMIETNPAQAQQRLLQIAPLIGAAIATRVPTVGLQFGKLSAMARLPLLEACAPSLGRLSDQQRLQLVKLARAFAAHTPTNETLRYATTRLILRTLVHKDQPRNAGANAEVLPITKYANELAIVMSTMAQLSGELGPKAYSAGMSSLLPPNQRPAYNASQIKPAELDAAVAQLAQLQHVHRAAIASALLRVLGANGTMSPGEQDVLRTLCADMNFYAPATGAIKLETPTARTKAAS